MKNKLIFLIASLLSMAVPSFAQTALTQTTITGALTTSQTNLQVASATGINAPTSFGGASQTAGTATLLVVDNEAMFVRSVAGTLIGVQRGASGTHATAHNANAIVWAATPNIFLSADPSGTCTAANTYTPTIVTTNAYRLQTHLWNCVGTTWQPLMTTGAITPAATAAAVGTSGQTFTVHGLVSGEPIYVASGPAPTSLCPLVGGAVTAANTVTLYFSTLTAAACTPAAGTYLIGVPRFSL